MKCRNCNNNHPAWSQRCPARKEEVRERIAILHHQQQAQIQGIATTSSAPSLDDPTQYPTPPRSSGPTTETLTRQPVNHHSQATQNNHTPYRPRHTPHTTSVNTTATKTDEVIHSMTPDTQTSANTHTESAITLTPDTLRTLLKGLMLILSPNADTTATNKIETLINMTLGGSNLTSNQTETLEVVEDNASDDSSDLEADVESESEGEEEDDTNHHQKIEHASPTPQEQPFTRSKASYDRESSPALNMESSTRYRHQEKHQGELHKKNGRNKQ
ncbi:hypothetical protein E2C01_083830 [Portunus trituberculatus]|uniref:Uncharacterized protein n=1 Tax=Portunus trituberculatus TaxID=210409 RepID=A0A5B7J4P0_PORTR|nr:hypothetical protein [Portunus trituberculatus]